MISLETFAKSPPLLHSWDNGVTWNTGGFSKEQLLALGLLVRERAAGHSTFIETGAGCSTVSALLGGASRVVSIAPEAELFTRINAYCDTNGIPRQQLETHTTFSELTLPSITESIRAQDKWIEIALLDGGHGWPTVFVDFCYLNSVVREGGLIIVDDVQLYSVKELARFLSVDYNFQFHSQLGGSPKTLVFEKKSSVRFLPDFGGQRYILQRTKEDQDAGTAYSLER